MRSHAISSFDDARRASGNFDGLFNPHDPKYRCCFQCCHVRLGVVLISIVELFAAVLAPSVSVATYISSFSRRGYVSGGEARSTTDKEKSIGANFILEDDKFLLATSVVSVLLAIGILVSVSLTLWGVSKQKRIFLIPHLIVQILVVFSFVMLIGLLSWSIASGQPGRSLSDQPNLLEKAADRKRRPSYVGLLVMLLIAAIIGVIMQLYFTRVTYQCYHYLKRRAIYERVASFAIAYGGGVF